MLNDKIIVHGEYTRAVNIERDDNISGYILTDNVLSMLRQIADNMALKTAPRAWHMVGPYGTGKSAFALYLSALLCGGEASKKAAAELAKRDKGLAKQFHDISERGFCPVFLSGTPELITPRLISRLTEALKTYLPAAAFSKFNKTVKSLPQDKSSALMEILRQAEQAVVNSGGDGILIIVDEMGKFLEHDADNPKSDNAFTFQNLGELTLNRKSKDGHILFVGIMHHDAGYYLRGQGRDAYNEWRKVEGRFEQMAFVESTEHVLRLLARMYECKLTPQEQKKTEATVSNTAKMVLGAGIFADHALNQSGEELFMECYPLHPATAVLLALLAGKIGQNERTMFAYVGGAQQHGFRDAVSDIKSVEECVPPWRLYDYFFAGGSHVFADSALRRIWAEVESAMYRLGTSAPAAQTEMLKTIALFNLAGARGGFSATPELLGAIIGDLSAAKRTLSTLAKQSLIIYRKFNNDYRIWQGSDFDLDGEVEEEIRRMGEFQLANALNENEAMPPIIAHKHAIETGNIRQLKPHFIDGKTWNNKENISAPRLIVFLGTAHDDEVFEKVRVQYESDNIVVRSDDTGNLKNIMQEHRALTTILQGRKELMSDPVAHKETRTRAAQIARMENRLIRKLASANGDCYWRGKQYRINSRRDLQEIVSRAMNEIYNAAPHIVNELINRDSPSTQAVGARKKLLEAALKNANKQHLGIQKYPPEKGMYMSLLDKTRLHRRVGGGKFGLCAPEKENDPCNYLPVWECISAFLSPSEKKPRAFKELDDVLQSPPFGVKKGMLPVFYTLFILTNKNISVYQEGKYSPFFDDAQLERFLARPDIFKFQRLPSDAQYHDILDMYRKVSGGGKSKDILSVTRPLIMLVKKLPDYAKNTTKISEEAQRLHKAVSHSQSPPALLTSDIPRALGMSDSDMTNATGRAKCDATLKSALEELTNAFNALLQHFTDMLADALQVKNRTLDVLRTNLAGRVDGLERYTIDRTGLQAFFRAAKDKVGDDEQWLKKLLLFLADKSPEKWDDSDSYRAEHKLAEYLRRTADLESLRAFEQRDSGDGDAALVRIISSRGEEEQHVRLTESPEMTKRRKEMESKLSNLPPSARLAVLTSVLESALRDSKKEKGDNNAQKPKVV